MEQLFEGSLLKFLEEPLIEFLKQKKIGIIPGTNSKAILQIFLEKNLFEKSLGYNHNHNHMEVKKFLGGISGEIHGSVFGGVWENSSRKLWRAWKKICRNTWSIHLGNNEDSFVEFFEQLHLGILGKKL